MLDIWSKVSKVVCNKRFASSPTKACDLTGRQHQKAAVTFFATLPQPDLNEAEKSEASPHPCQK